MNIQEANDFNTMLSGLDPDAGDGAMSRALQAVERLGDRAFKALSAGVDGKRAREQVDHNLTILLWGEDYGSVRTPRIETAVTKAEIL